MARDSIVLPSDATLVRKLQGKLLEYATRINENQFGHPESNGDIVRNSTYKGFVLATLLRTGSVDSWNVSQALALKLGGINLGLFNEAYGVIRNYCLMENVEGGTGLVLVEINRSDLETAISKMLD